MPTDPKSLYPYIIYRCVMGSRAFGLDQADSDTDRRGFYLPPADLHWSLAGVPEQLEDEAAQECYWELQKFVVMALKGNPNILECLYSPLVETVTPLAQELLDMREIFLSQLIYGTFQGYAVSQFRKMERDLRTQGAFRPKHAMHLLRLLLEGIVIMREGYLPIRMDTHRERLLAVRHNELSWDEIVEWQKALSLEFEEAFASTRLPALPDYARANDFLIRARRSAL